MQEYKPLVSIIIPVYNGGNYMREAIDSALAQTYKNIEVIVVNDGSTDEGETERIALSYGDKIRYFYKENGGVSTALNLGIKNMRGDYFSWLSHDDKYAPEKIASQVRLLSQFSNEKVLALCGTQQINKDSQFIGKNKKLLLKEKQLISGNDILIYLFEKSVFNGCALLIPKAAFDESGLFDENLRYSQDLFMWAKIFLNGYKLVYENDTNAFMRIHNGQLTQRGIDIFHKDSEYISEYLIPEFAQRTNKQNRYMYAYAKYNAKYNNSSVCKACLRQKKVLSFIERGKIRFIACYGKVRPTIRRIYYWIFKQVKTR